MKNLENIPTMSPATTFAPTAASGDSTWTFLLIAGGVGLLTFVTVYICVKRYMNSKQQKLNKELDKTSDEIDKTEQQLENEEDQIKHLEAQFQHEQQRFNQLQAERNSLEKGNNRTSLVNANNSSGDYGTRNQTPPTNWQGSNHFFSAEEDTSDKSNTPFNRKLDRNDEKLTLAEHKSRDLDHQVSHLEEASAQLLQQQEMAMKSLATQPQKLQ